MTGWTSKTSSNRTAKQRLPAVGAFTVAVICLPGGLAVAEGEHETTVSLQIEEVGQRLAEIERIEVTAEKTPAASTKDIDAEIEAILEEAEVVERDESDE